MKTRNKVLAALLGTTLAISSLAGCGAKEAPEEATAEIAAETSKEEASAEISAENPAEEAPGETVNIKWHRTAWHTNVDEKAVEEAINEYIEPLIGVTVTVLNDAENTALDLALAAGEDIDLFWVASWSNAYTFIDGNIAYDLTDVIADYPALYESMPKSIWESAKTEGRNFYVPIYKEAANQYGLTVPTALVEKYGWDLSAIKELKDIEPMLADAAADGMNYPFGMNTYYFSTFHADDFAFMTPYAGVARNGDTTKVVNIIESPEYAEYVAMMNDWNKKGYINQAEAALETMGEDIVTELRQADPMDNAFYPWVMTPASKANASNRYGVEVEVIPISKSYIETDSPAGSAYMINAKTEKLDACMKFLELLSTDEKLANLAAYGIEGKHYTLENGRVSLIPDSGYAYPGVWIVCNVNAPTLMVGEDDDKKEQYEAFNLEAEPSVTAGFRFDRSKVEAEAGALDAVMTEYQHLTDLGFYTVDDLPKFQEALKNAGIDTVIAELQAQYDAFLATK